MANNTKANHNLPAEQDDLLEKSLRPKFLTQVIGMEQHKKTLKVMIESAKKREKPIDHLLFHGSPGLGKTSLAFVTSNEMGVPIHVTNGSLLQKAGDLAAILTSLEKNSILFIDEIHRLRENIEEVLYPVMEDNMLDIILGKGPNAKNIRLSLEPFTLIGATTKLSMLSHPLRDRFGMHIKAEFYTDDELQLIIIQKAKLLDYRIEKDGALLIAQNGRKTPRIAIRILQRARDLAIYNKVDIINYKIVLETLDMMNITDFGLTDTDKKIISVMYNNFDNRPVGIKTIAAALSEEADTVETVYEPYLIQIGFIKRTPQGRVLTDNAINYLQSKLNI